MLTGKAVFILAAVLLSCSGTVEANSQGKGSAPIPVETSVRSTSNGVFVVASESGASHEQRMSYETCPGSRE